MGAPTGQEIHRMGNHVEDGGERLDGSSRRPGSVQDQGLTSGPGNRSAQPTEPVRIAEPHGLGETGRISLDGGLRTLRGQVSRPESRSSRGDDQAVETCRQLDERVAHRLETIGDGPTFDDRPPGGLEVFLYCCARTIFSRAGDDTIGCGDHLGEKGGFCWSCRHAP